MKEDGESSPSAPNLDSPGFQNHWESYAEEIDNYFQHLLSLNLDEVDRCEQESDTSLSYSSPMEAEMKKLQTSNLVNCPFHLFILLFY